MHLAAGRAEGVRCAIYVRLSKEDGDRHGRESESIQNQKDLLIRYAADRGWEVVGIYCDEDYSGADRQRPDFNRMLQAAQDGEFQILLCKSQSRFTRDMELVEKYLHGLFPLWGVRFLAVADNADTQVKGNKKARQINGLVNEWYLEDLSENVRMVLDGKRRQGKYIGGAPLYGYRKDPADKNRLLVDGEAAGVVRDIFRWSLAGAGKQEIARRLNAQGVPGPARYKRERGWGPAGPAARPGGERSKTAVWRILRNEMYTGVMVQGRRRKVSYKSKAVVDVPQGQWFRVEGTHQAIVSWEVFQAVQQGLTLRSRSSGRGKAHRLSGLVKCLDCGSTMGRTEKRRRDGPGLPYLRCQGYAAEGSGRCTRHSIRLDRLLELVSQRVRAYVQEHCPLEVLELSPPRDSRTETLEREQRALTAQWEKRRQALRELYLDKTSGAISAEQFAALNREFLAEQDRLERRLEGLRGELEQESAHGQLPWRERARALLRLEEVPRELMALLIEKIEIGEKDPETGGQEVRIRWRF